MRLCARRCKQLPHLLVHFKVHHPTTADGRENQGSDQEKPRIGAHHLAMFVKRDSGIVRHPLVQKLQPTVARPVELRVVTFDLVKLARVSGHEDF